MIALLGLYIRHLHCGRFGGRSAMDSVHELRYYSAWKDQQEPRNSELILQAE